MTGVPFTVGDLVTPSNFLNRAPQQLEAFELASATASVEFASISQDFTHLCLILHASHDGTGFIDMLLTFNSQTGSTDYRFYRRSEDGAGTVSRQVGDGSGIRAAVLSDAENGLAPYTIWIPNYTTSSVRRTIRSSGGAQNGTTSTDFRDVTATGWSDVAVTLSSIQLSMLGGDNFVTGSTFSLYGLP